MAIKPPKCKTCGAEEWRHTCGPAIDFWREAAGVKPGMPKRTLAEASKDFMTPENLLPLTAAKPSRKEYLKLKARERRARQKAKP